MKKIFSLALSIFCFSLTHAQAPLNNPEKESSEIFSRTLSSQSNSSRQLVSEWYNYGETLDALGGNVTYYRNYLFPDSTVLANFSGGVSSVWKHSYGQMCDPSSITFINNTLIDNNTAYTLDSLLVWYRYYRFQHGAPDTLVVQVFADNKIQFANNQWADSLEFGNVPYDTVLFKGKSPSYEYTILLDDDDTSTAQQQKLILPVGANAAAGEKFVATVTYFPGNPYAFGDTIDPTMTVTNQINAFAIYDYKDFDKDQNQTFYNNGMIAATEVRYNISTNGWNGDYIAGNAYNAGYYYLDVAFKLTSNSSLIENSIAPFSIGLFPNLVQNQNALLQLITQKNSEAQISIADISGKIVWEKNFIAAPGTNKISLPVENISSGIYFVNAQIDGAIKTLKLVVL